MVEVVIAHWGQGTKEDIEGQGAGQLDQGFFQGEGLQRGSCLGLGNRG